MNYIKIFVMNLLIMTKFVALCLFWTKIKKTWRKNYLKRIKTNIIMKLKTSLKINKLNPEDLKKPKMSRNRLKMTNKLNEHKLQNIFLLLCPFFFLHPFKYFFSIKNKLNMTKIKLYKFPHNTRYDLYYAP